MTDHPEFEIPVDRALYSAERPVESLDRAWRALDLAPSDLGARRAVARQLRDNPDAISAERRDDLARLAVDSDIAPEDVAVAGWKLVLSDPAFAQGVEAAAKAIESDRLALSVLSESCVFVLDAELALSAVRRWLLLDGKFADHPRLADALVAQAALNGGAWPFDADEAAALDRAGDFVRAYRCDPPSLSGREGFADATTQAIAEQYSQWPYPTWSRITVPEATAVPATVEKLDGGRPSGLPVQSRILVAGCGTGRESALLARRYPDAQVTAIDISEPSLAYARERCRGLGIAFRLLDLHDVAQVGQGFHLIACSGVLHHLRDPESGWAKLAEVLEPGGVMKVMVYSRIARLRIEAAKARIADLRDQPVTDDLLRQIRKRLRDGSPDLVSDFADFYSLAGVHDLLLNPHEDLFDVPRIARGVEALNLEFLGFRLPSRSDELRYRAEHPEDPLFRDFGAWSALERSNPLVFSGMYEFWCRRPS